ncbi:MAG: SRPBCC family protein [Leptolyngbya sp.]|nr:SRPBCC family protein [Candidatus Melainabacteria bacterium]
MAKKILIGVGVILLLIGAFVGYASTKPDVFEVQRSLVINAPAEKIFPHVNNFHAWEAWSPYEAKDPKMKRSFSGPESGKGAKYAWDGNDEVGAGNMEMQISDAPNKISIRLEFTKPFQGVNTAEFTFTPQGEGTNVVWKMTGPNPLMCKVMQTIMDMDKMCGDDFAKGLAKLKALAEK